MFYETTTFNYILLLRFTNFNTSRFQTGPRQLNSFELVIKLLSISKEKKCRFKHSSPINTKNVLIDKCETCQVRFMNNAYKAAGHNQLHTTLRDCWYIAWEICLHYIWKHFKALSGYLHLISFASKSMNAFDCRKFSKHEILRTYKNKKSSYFQTNFLLQKVQYFGRILAWPKYLKCSEHLGMLEFQFLSKQRPPRI